MNFSFIRDRRSFSDFIFILWAGGAALLSYSLVYALRKPFTAATFDGLSIWGMDYKVVVTITQILGYLLAKFIGIKLISELKGQHRLKFTDYPFMHLLYSQLLVCQRVCLQNTVCLICK